MRIINTQQIGNQGENSAANFLVGKNYQVVARNYHSRYGEIDIIAIDKDELIFVEVKTRSTSLENALSSISKSKQQKLYKTAGIYLSEHQQYQNWFTRFDVIVVLNHTGNKPQQIHHIPNAFSSI